MGNHINFVILKGVVIEKANLRAMKSGKMSLLITLETREHGAGEVYKNKFELFFLGEKAEKAWRDIRAFDEIQIEGRLVQLRHKIDVSVLKFEVTRPQEDPIIIKLSK